MDDALRLYERASRALYETELRIASLEFRNAGGVDAKILPSLIARRDRLAVEVIDLKIAADAARPVTPTSRAGSHVVFPPARDYPIGTAPREDVISEMPEFLRRAS